MQHVFGYARVSTAGQSTDNQVDALKESGCTEVFVENAVSGSRNHLAPQYRALIKRAKELREDGDDVTVRVTKLDRFSRSTQHLLEGVKELGDVGVSFEALYDNFTHDAKSPMSRLLLTMMGALAEFERELIRSRMAEGRAAKRAKGQISGQKPALRLAAVEAIRASYATGTTTDRQLAAQWNVSRSTIDRVLGIHGFTKPYISLDEWEAAKKKAND
jgi:DNA invertase Pin-like site-specific DNA recombinase